MWDDLPDDLDMDNPDPSDADKKRPPTGSACKLDAGLLVEEVRPGLGLFELTAPTSAAAGAELGRASGLETVAHGSGDGIVAEVRSTPLWTSRSRGICSSTKLSFLVVIASCKLFRFWRSRARVK